MYFKWLYMYICIYGFYASSYTFIKHIYILGNTVGRDNYKFFLGLLLCHAIGGMLWLVVAFTYYMRTRSSYLFIIFVFYSMLWLIMIFCLGGYHAQLVFSALTTNEHMNMSRYTHFRGN